MQKPNLSNSWENAKVTIVPESVDSRESGIFVESFCRKIEICQAQAQYISDSAKLQCSCNMGLLDFQQVTIYSAQPRLWRIRG